MCTERHAFHHIRRNRCTGVLSAKRAPFCLFCSAGEPLSTLQLNSISSNSSARSEYKYFRKSLGPFKPWTYSYLWRGSPIACCIQLYSLWKCRLGGLGCPRKYCGVRGNRYRNMPGLMPLDRNKLSTVKRSSFFFFLSFCSFFLFNFFFPLFP